MYVSYTYTDREFRSLIAHIEDGLVFTPAYFLLFPLIAGLKLLDSDDRVTWKMFFIVSLIALTIMILFCFFIYSVFKREIPYIKAKQIISIDEQFFCYTSGGHVFKIDRKRLMKIRQSKYFYRIDIYIDRYEKGLNRLYILPHIPRRAVTRARMVELAETLHIEYKDSRRWKDDTAV